MSINDLQRNACYILAFFYFCGGVSLVRPAPAKLPQDRNVARVGGCSGAMQVAYPFFNEIYF